MSGVVIVGGSHAGTQAAISLRQCGYTDEIRIIDEGPTLPYHRPPLSKEFLKNPDQSIDEYLLRSQESYDDLKILLTLGTRVEEINPRGKNLKLENGKECHYDKLIIATGARARRLDLPIDKDMNLFYLRNAQDVLNIRSKVRAGKKCLVIGGGYIGLETAACLRSLGVEVTVLEAMDRILQRVTAPVISDFFRRLHKEENVDIFENEMVTEISHSHDLLHVATQNGKIFSADMIVVGVGVIPNTELASHVGLQTSNGIHVDDHLLTSDPNIYAIGDVSWHHNKIYDCHIRLESVPNATEQARVVAKNICGTDAVYDSLPWFWSDQYDVKLQIAGLAQNHTDYICRGDPNTGRSFAVFYFDNDRLLAVDAINSPQAFMVTKSVLTKGWAIDKNVLADTNVDLKNAISR